jgi:hypothetical protein
MGILLSFQTVAEIQAPPRIERLRRRARVLAAIFDGLFWFVAVSTAAGLLGALLYHGRHAAFGPEGGIVWTGDESSFPMKPGYRFMDEITLPYRLGMLFAGTTQFVPAVMVMYHLRGLFRLYAKGIVFSNENARAFKRMGQWLLAFAVTPFLSVEILTLLDLVIDRAWFHSVEIYSLFLGAVLFIIAEVMEAGREIEQERDEFV